MPSADYVTKTPSGTKGESHWMLCATCDGCWEPGAKSKHEPRCPVAELERIEAAARPLPKSQLLSKRLFDYHRYSAAIWPEKASYSAVRMAISWRSYHAGASWMQEAA